MTNPRNHLKAFLFGTLGWALFFVIGLPDYYQQYSTDFMIAFSILILPPLWAAAVLLSHWLEGEAALPKLVLLSFYVTVPLLVYDALYCGLYLGNGWGFLTKYWYLSIYYLIPWLVLPVTGLWLDRGRPSQEGETP